MAIITNTGRIPDNTPASMFRMSCENKNLLTDKGDMYIGTGNTENVTSYACISSFVYQGVDTISFEYVGNTTTSNVFVYSSDGNYIGDFTPTKQTGTSTRLFNIDVSGRGLKKNVTYYICIQYQDSVAETTKISVPKNDGTYYLRCDVKSGVVTTSWVSGSPSSSSQSLTTTSQQNQVNIAKGLEIVKKSLDTIITAFGKVGWDANANGQGLIDAITSNRDDLADFLAANPNIFVDGTTLNVNSGITPTQSPTTPGTLICP